MTVQETRTYCSIQVHQKFTSISIFKEMYLANTTAAVSWSKPSTNSYLKRKNLSNQMHNAGTYHFLAYHPRKSNIHTKTWSVFHMNKQVRFVCVEYHNKRKKKVTMKSLYISISRNFILNLISHASPPKKKIYM